jgi:hypothetical protein
MKNMQKKKKPSRTRTLQLLWRFGFAFSLDSPNTKNPFFSCLQWYHEKYMMEQNNREIESEELILLLIPFSLHFL